MIVGIHESVITDPVAIVIGCGGREKEKRSGAWNQSTKRAGRWWNRKRDAEHVLPYSFTQRLRSMLTLVPRFTLDQPDHRGASKFGHLPL
jgi:hypothetical protein